VTFVASIYKWPFIYCQALFVNARLFIVLAMSPRTRGKPDSELLAAAARVIERIGPHRLTLGEVARETGLAPATLLQRFGSKRGLLLAVAGLGASGVQEEFARIRAISRSPLRAIAAVARCMAQMAKTPEALANHLAFLEMDLGDREFHRLALAQARQFHKEVRALLDEAVRSGELRKCPTTRLATAVQAMIGGSLLGWAIYREGKAEAWILRDVDILLRPYRRNSS
jgi:AcrR family transcriptional regulator